MIPLRDNIPTHSRPTVTIGLIVVNVAVFLLQIAQPDGGERAVWKYGFIPAAMTSDATELREALDARAAHRPRQLVIDRYGRLRTLRPPSYAEDATAVAPEVKLFTCMFMHGGWMHLLGNMLYLWIFGNNIEDRLGPALFAVFYLGTGVIGTVTHTLVDSASLAPMLGASGAISGVLGAYIVLFPHARVETLVPIGFYLTTIQLPAWVFLGVYAVLQVLNGLPALSHVSGGGVAYWAHIGGFAAGLVLIHVLPRRRYARPLSRLYTDDQADDNFFGF